MQPALVLVLFLIACLTSTAQAPYVQILGVAQDGGYPHIGCEKTCCAAAREDVSKKQLIVSLALVDPASRQWWLFEATPDIQTQLHLFRQNTKGVYPFLPAGIFLTHAHMGHYTGLLQLGREALASNEVPVYVLPRFEKFLSGNGPWSQLVTLRNISLQPLTTQQPLQISPQILVSTMIVPHRDEFSETAGFQIALGTKRVLFIPDIDKWEKWSLKIEDVVREVDVALIDATFYTATELPNRNMHEIPHPLVIETMARFEAQPELKKRLWFIHFNHTNPLLWDKSEQENVRKKGFQVAETGMIIR